MKNYCLVSGKSLQILIVLILIAVALFSPIKTFADCENNFVDIEVAKLYLQRNPYIIASYSSIKGQASHLFKVEQVYMDEGQLTVSGPLILSWKENEYRQRTYKLPDSAQVFTDGLCGNYHYGYYKPMRAAFPLADILGLTGGDVNHVSEFWAFPGPDVIPVVEKGYADWMEQLPEVVKEYCLWWNENASIGPPVFYELIDSVLSFPEGGPFAPPNVYIDRNHCPGEGCQYGTWKTSEDIVIVDKPYCKKKIGIIPAGDTFTAITGDVYLTPIEVIVGQPIEVYDSLGSIVLNPGRKYYILSNIGEGVSKIWVNGRIMEYGAFYNPTQKWWVQVKTRKGKIGWILYPDSACISGSDYLE